MPYHILCPVALALTCTAVFAQASGDVGHWAFEQTLEDSSGAGNHATGTEVRFCPGHQGYGVDLAGKALSVPSKPGLQLSPGLVIDVWVRFESAPQGYEQIVRKDGEYYLRNRGQP